MSGEEDLGNDHTRASIPSEEDEDGYDPTRASMISEFDAHADLGTGFKYQNEHLAKEAAKKEGFGYKIDYDNKTVSLYLNISRIIQTQAKPSKIYALESMLRNQYPGYEIKAQRIGGRSKKMREKRLTKSRKSKKKGKTFRKKGFFF